MIVDTSAVVAIFRAEPSAAELSELLLTAERALMSAATYVELCCVLDSRTRPEDRRRLDAVLKAYGVEIIAFTPSQSDIARDAYRDFGKGSGHRARLNMGDCFSYALACETGEELLFCGDDFIHTDVQPAWRP